MKRVLCALMVVSLALSSSAVRGDNFQDTFWIDLDESQISSGGPGERWVLDHLSTSGDLLFTGDSYTAHIRFLNNELLEFTGLGEIDFLTRAVSSALYGVDCTFSVNGPDGPRAWFASATSNISGIAGGWYDFAPDIPSFRVGSLDVQWELTSGTTMFDTVDVGLAGGQVTIIPEPSGLALMIGGLIVAGWRPGRRLVR